MSDQMDFYMVSLKVILKNDQGEILCLKGVQNGSFAGYYDLPGGRIDVSEFETPYSVILNREIEEELGKIEYQLTANKPVAIGRHLLPAKYTSSKEKDLHILYVFFEADYTGGDLKISDEHDGLKWINLSEIKLEEYFKSGILEGINMYLYEN